MTGLLAATSLQDYEAGQLNAALALVWSFVGLLVVTLLWPGGKGRRVARQIFALAVLGFREGLRQNVLWMMFGLALIAGLLAFWSDSDGTHVGRARLIVETCFSVGEVLGASLIVLLAALSVSREIESRIMYTLGTKPVPRWAILAGKALGFWCVELVFALALTVFTGLLVRAIPLRPESRPSVKVTDNVNAGDADQSWELLRRKALTTRIYRLPQNASGKPASLTFIKAGEQQNFDFAVERSELRGEALELKFQLASSMAFAPQIGDLLLKVGYEGKPPLIDRTMTVASDRPFNIFVNEADVQNSGALRVTIGASAMDKYKSSVIVPRLHGVRAGLAIDGLAANLSKSFVLLALQGWILAMITTGWSGVLSFPVSVALGLLLVMGGEMSRQALSLLESNAEKMQAMAAATGAGQGGPSEGLAKAMAPYIANMLQILPDFRTAGGPAAFMDGNFISSWRLAHAIFWMGVVRGLAWALPGLVSFQRREVGA